MEQTKKKIFSLTKDDINKIFGYGKFILIALLIVYGIEFVRFTKPLWDRIYFGNLTKMFINVCRIFLYIPTIVFLFRYSKFFLPIDIDKEEHKELSLTRTFILYLLTLAIIVIVSASLNWKVKLVDDLGENITGMAVVNNVSDIVAHVVKMFLVLLVLRYAQELFEVLFKNFKYNKLIPWGGLFTLVSFGIFELVSAGISSLNIVFFLMHIIYGIIYLINKKYYPTSLVINILILLF